MKIQIVILAYRKQLTKRSSMSIHFCSLITLSFGITDGRVTERLINALEVSKIAVVLSKMFTTWLGKFLLEK